MLCNKFSQTSVFLFFHSFIETEESVLQSIAVYLQCELKKGIPFMNNKSILYRVCLESVDLRLNFYLILLSEYLPVHYFSSITEISITFQKTSGQGKTAMVCVQPVAVAHCLRQFSLKVTYCVFLWREFLRLAFDSEKSSVWFEFQMP